MAGSSDHGEGGFPDREALLSGRSRRRRQPNLLFLLESWSDSAEEDIFAFLESTEAFAGLAHEELRLLLPHLEPVHVPAGAVVIQEGDVGNELFVVVYGRLQVYRADDDGGRVVAAVGPGQVVGEAGLLVDLPRTASVQAVRDSLLLRLSRTDLERFAESHPAIPFRLIRQLVRRMVARDAAADPREAAPGTVAIVPVGRSPIPAEFAADLTKTLDSSSDVARVNSQSVDRELGAGAAEIAPDDPRNGTLVEWLQRIERAHRLVVYEADASPTTWTRRCLRQADRLLLVSLAAGSPALSDVEVAFLGAPTSETTARRELVLLHSPGAAAPSGTTAWLAAREVAAHHHVRLGDAQHYRRLARFITGRAVGVVFGGGGARGSAHLGVLRALEEAGVPIDAAGGTSIGSVVAAMAALQWDDETRIRKLPRFFSRRLILQPTIPLVSLSSGRRLLRLLNEESAGRPIEDLWIPFFCVSTNLSRAQQVVHDRGNLALSVRASVSLPGVLPPVREDTDLLVDGGLLNNLPVDVMQRVLGGGRVVAVDLRRQIELRMHAAWGPELSGWEVLWRRLLPGGKASKPPGIGSILMRTVELAGLLTDRDLVGRPGIDVYLQPPVAQWGTFDFKSAPLLVDEAYRYAAGELRRLPLAELFDA